MTIVMNVNRTGETATARVTTNVGKQGRIQWQAGTLDREPGKVYYKGREIH